MSSASKKDHEEYDRFVKINCRYTNIWIKKIDTFCQARVTVEERPYAFKLKIHEVGPHPDYKVDSSYWIKSYWFIYGGDFWEKEYAISNNKEYIFRGKYSDEMFDNISKLESYSTFREA